MPVASAVPRTEKAPRRGGISPVLLPVRSTARGALGAGAAGDSIADSILLSPQADDSTLATTDPEDANGLLAVKSWMLLPAYASQVFHTAPLPFWLERTSSGGHGTS